ncbi:MAG: hypothetical protein ACI8RZ_001214 [Myxococcota bacterium]|jgi:hypothetical protein
MLLFLFACNGSPDDTGPIDDDALSDCLSVWSDQLTEPDIDGPDTQIHGTSAFDGGGVWVAWSRPNDASTFDIWLTRVGCDGTTDIAPIAVTDSADNELDPSIIVSGDRLLVAWSTSTSGGLGIRHRLYDLTGIPLTPTTDLAASRDGVAVTGNASSPRLAALSDGFLLAGFWGHDDAPAFQAFSVELDLDGAIRGEATDGELDADNGQTAVDVAVSGGGDVVLAWQEDSTTSTAPIAYQADAGESATLLGSPGARPAVAIATSGTWSAWDTDDGTVWIRPPSGADFALDLDGFSHSARLAPRSDGVVALTMTVDDGLYNALSLSSITADGTVSTIALDTLAAPAVYGVDVTMVGADHAVVVWQEGDSPAFRLRAQWVTLP